MKYNVIFFLLLSYVTSFAQVDNSKSPLFVSNDQLVWVDSIIDRMTIDEKIGQLFVVDAFSNGNRSNENAIVNMIKKYHVGGLVFFKGDPLSQVKLTNRYQSLSTIPLMIAMDAEWGVAMRLSDTPKLPMQMVIAASNNVDNAYDVADIIANECSRLGVQMNYAPVADININPQNPIIGRRSFGEKKELVAEYSVSSLKAYRDNGVLACAKHFPGHGDTSQDSHLTLPSVTADIDRIRDVELYPFEKLIDKQLTAVMVAHLQIPALEQNKKIPSSLSPKVIDSLLKRDMNFKGLVISDALNMRGVQSFGTNEEINVQAFIAGNDVLLYPMSVSKTVVKFKSEIKNGKIAIDRLDESVRKILMAKYWANLGDYSPVDTLNLLSDLNTSHSEDVIRKVTRESITLLKNEGDILPIVDVEKKIANVIFGEDKFPELNSRLNDYGKVDVFHVNSYNFKELSSKLKKYSTIIISVDNPLYSKRKNKVDYNREYAQIRNQIKVISQNKSVILNLIGDPYSLSKYGDDRLFDAIVVSYKKTIISQEYSASTIFGANSPSGVLPVSINEVYKAGTSLSFNEIGRLSYSTPALEGMNPLILIGIDSIVNNAIEDGAMPGAQVLVARNGKIVYNKSFGYKTYKEEDKICNEDIYDVASLTKILATTPIVMKMVDDELLDIDAPIKNYLPELDTTSKADITIREMMSHYARLKSWIPFYPKTLDRKGNPDMKKYYSVNYNSKYQLKVANNLYLRNDYKDSMIYEVFHSELRDTLEYKYSDLPYYFLQSIIEKKERKALDKLAYGWFYKPLGRQRIGYKPKNFYDAKKIVPSEDDAFFRKRILVGDVNDPGAAMLGGVSGHAGVFANSYDVAVIMQMYLQDGYYGGKRYFNYKTLKEFTRCQYCDNDNRRGIGFDKPQLEGEGPACDCVSYLSFGHSGYTGTLAWADPDEKIVYIFLSNRTFPVSTNNKLVKENIRTRIQTVIYDSLEDSEQ
ncbi:MAG: serine hydrolase [Flavobacteriales bacterium]|nr:serine hydrolase [Flavobacteriales bacterium]